MKLGTTTRILPGLIALASLGTWMGCDRGTAALCDASDSTCLAVRETPTAFTGSGSPTGGGSGGQTDNGGGSGVGGGNVDAAWDPAYDIGSDILTVAKAALLGKPDILGGDQRRIVFSVTDSTLNITASSDGASQTNSGRETVYDLKILSTDSIDFGWDSKTDNGLIAKAATGVDDATIFDPHPLYVTALKMPVISRALEAHLTARRGTVFKIWVKVRSGDPLGSTEDSLPRLDITSTRALLFSGVAFSAIGSDPFSLTIP